MLGTAITAALAAIQLPPQLPIPAELARAEVEVVVQATANHFAAENRSMLEQVLLFGSGERGAFGAVRLSPGQRVVYPFPRGAVDDLLLEVLALDDGWRNTGALSLREVRDSLSGALWIQGAAGRSVGWVDGPSGLLHAAPVSELLPAPLIHTHPGLQDYSLAAAHVPVPLPAEGKGTKPPVLEKEHLPPV